MVTPPPPLPQDAPVIDDIAKKKMKLSMINSDPKRKPSFPLSLELSFVAFQIKQNKKHLNFFIFFNFFGSKI